MSDTMTRKEALTALLEKVEAGEIDRAPFWKVWTPESQDGPLAYIAQGAADGSLDAALALHEAVLPGWVWLIRETGECFLHSPDFDSVTWTAGDHTRTDVLSGLKVSSQDDNPARAWVIAIIKALIEQETIASQ